MKPEFAELGIQPMALKNQFSRMQNDVLKAAGISMEGANLSGLSEEPSELVTLLCKMAKKVVDMKIVGKEKKKKQKEKETSMNITERRHDLKKSKNITFDFFYVKIINIHKHY